MSPYRAALLALVVVGGALVTAAPAGATSGVDATHDAIGATGVQVDGTADRASVESARLAAQNESENNSSLGADISSFMQSSAAETDGAVETGMWSAAFNGTENRSVREQLVERRTSELRTELAELQEQKEQLLAEREAGNVSETAYKAKISRLVGQINALKSSINATSSRAKEVNTNVEELENLGTEAKNLTGPEIASVARNVTGADVENGAGGPPADVGNGNGASDAGNEAGNGNGPSDAGNGTAGPPDDAGPGTNETNASQRDLPADSANASQSDPPSDSGNAPMVGNASETPMIGNASGNETPAANASAPDESSGAGNGSAASADESNQSAVSSVTTVTTDLVEPLAGFDHPAHALDVRTYAVTHALAAA